MTVRTFPLSGPVNLAVRLGHGSLAVHCSDGLAEARVEVTPRPGSEEYAERISVDMSGPTLTVAAPRQGGVFDVFGDLWRTNSGVDIVVAVPSGTAMKIATFTAGVRVEGRSGGVDIATGSARVDLDEVGGDLKLRSGSATTTVGRVNGSAHVRTGSGDVHFAEVTGNLDCLCGNGQLIADLVRGVARCRAGSGTAELRAVYGDVDLASGSGPLRVGLPAGVTARLDLQTGAGRVSSDLPVEQHPAERAGAITVRARTGSGNVHLFRAASAA